MGIIRTILFYSTLDRRSMKRLRWCYAQLALEASLNMDNIDGYLNQHDIAKAIDGLSSCYLELDDDRKLKGVKKVLLKVAREHKMIRIIHKLNCNVDIQNDSRS